MSANGTDPHGRPVDYVYPSDKPASRKAGTRLIERLSSAKAIIAIFVAVLVAGWGASQYMAQFAKNDALRGQRGALDAKTGELDDRVSALESLATEQRIDLKWIKAAIWAQANGQPVAPPP